MLKKLISLFATLLFFGVVAAQNQADIQEFLNNQFLILEQVQPLTQAERESMESIFREEYAETGIRDIAFNKAMSRTLRVLEYYEHYYKEDIAKRAYLLFNVDLAYYSENMRISATSLEAVKPHLKERAREMALSETCLFAYPEELLAAKEYIMEMFDKNISDVYIRNDSKGASFNLGLVLENRERLNLDGVQVDAVVEAAQTIKELTAEGDITERKNNLWLYEREFIMQILTEEQVGDFAVIRYTDEAVRYALDMWNEGKLYEIEYGNDSIKVLNELFNYRVNKLKIQYIHLDDKEKMLETENFWYREAYPKFLSQVMTERRRRQFEVEDDRDNLRF